MKYYSEKLRKFYDTADGCASAEKEYEYKLAKERIKNEELANTRKARAKEVDEAWEAVRTAQKKYVELRNKFVKDYGSWHMTISEPKSFTDLFTMLTEL